ncbi:hypothetical protein [Amycolatopsis xylanica]|nr:hypothetical protein [Amycolatopsis xylanica]
MRTSSGMTMHSLDEFMIRLMVNGLRPEEYLIVQYDDDPPSGDPNVHYSQVRRRPEGDYQLEYRAGGPAEHYQTFTANSDDVVTAFVAWSRGETSWRNAHEWKSIGDWFDHS